MYKTIWRHFDWISFLVTLALVLIGGVMIYSSYEASLPSKGTSLLENAVFRQMIFGALGVVLYLVFTAIDYHFIASLHRWIYLFILGILGLTLFVGSERFGAQSWIFGLQPSELCKVLMIIVLARFLGDDPEKLESLLPFLVSALLVAPPAVLIYLQDDFGTAMILAAIWLGMAFLAGVRWRHMLILAATGVAAMPIIWLQLKGYMRERITTFFLPNTDPSGSSYNITQALISIGSGGWWGKGLLHGTQSQLYFLRVRHTDFIFSVLAEEFGFVGAVLFIGLFAILILRLIRRAAQARDAFGRLIIGGVATMLLAQSVVNLGMNANLLPVTGLPLPLVSYGGSALVATLLALGLTQSVNLRYRDPEPTLF